jgi:site-specific DNA recombinase
MLGIYCRTSKDRNIETSTISQQRSAGIKFAEENNFEYELYEDQGKSGYIVSDDDSDPFNNRPAFVNLINDIKDKKIDKVWVWEHSRLSRNDFASAYIFRIFRKHKIVLYENKKVYDLDDPIKDLNRKILDAVADYERHLIISRTTRGLHKSINEGKRVHKKLYGYQKSGKDMSGHSVFIPVESEINNYKHAFQRYMEGASLMKICFEIHGMNKIEKRQLPNYAYNLGKLLRGYQYTGYQLTIEGKDIYKKFRSNETESLKILLDRKYWVKSIPYPIEMITIEDWVKICERLQLRGKKVNATRKERQLRASKDIATGIIECGICGKRYYYHETKSENKEKVYLSYFHIATINSSICSQRPRSYKLDDINEIFKSFYFYFKVVFDNRNEQIKESLRNSKQIMLKNKERQLKVENEISLVEKSMERYQKKAKDPDLADDLFDIVLRNMKSSENEYNDLNMELSKLRIEYELENEKYDKNEREMTYYDVKDKVNEWFFRLSVEDQRNELIRNIHTCKIFSHHLIIDTGKIIFLFDIQKREVFDMNLLNNLNKDEVYKRHFVEMKGKREARKFNERQIHNVDLNRNKVIRMRVFQYLIKTYNIVYDISEKTNLVSFAPLTGLLGFKVEQFDNEE